MDFTGPPKGVLNPGGWGNWDPSLCCAWPGFPQSKTWVIMHVAWCYCNQILNLLSLWRNFAIVTQGNLIVCECPLYVESLISWDIRLCSPLEISQCSRGTCCLHLQGWKMSQARNQCKAGDKLVSCLAYFLTLKMEATCSSERLVDFQQTT
jgi:hypothetical protein